MADRGGRAVYFTYGCVSKAGHVCIAAKLSELKPQVRFARMYFYRAPSDEWGRAEQSWHVASLCSVDDPSSYWALAGTGEVARYSLLDGGGEEKIRDAKKYGMLHEIRAIAGALYVCGRQGQVYRRGAQGWAHVDDGILNPNISEGALHLRSIDGTAADDLYVVGSGGRIRHYDGSSWRALASPSDKTLTRVLCTGGVAYACGERGTFLRIAAGNVEELSIAVDDFVGMAALGANVYLATRAGLYVFDGQRVTPLDTGLEPALAGGPLDARDGELWSFGEDDLAYYDGQRWRRVLHPDNRPPRAPSIAPVRYRTTDHQEAMKLVKARARKLADTIYMPRPEYSDADDDDHWTVRIYDDDQTLAGDFTIETGIVVFAGDLTVSGSLFDCGAADHTLTVVLGDLRVKNAILCGEWLVAGDLRCEGLLYEDSLNDYTLTVGGSLEARVIVNAGMYTEVRGALVSEQMLALSNDVLVGPKKNRVPRTEHEHAQALTRALFAREYHDQRVGTPDEHKLRAALSAGKNVLLASSGVRTSFVARPAVAKAKQVAGKAKRKAMPEEKARPKPKAKPKPKARPKPKAKPKPERKVVQPASATRKAAVKGTARATRKKLAVKKGKRPSRA